MTRILHLIGSSFYGGPEKQILEHLTRLSKNYSGCVASFLEGNETNNEFLDKAAEMNIENFNIKTSGPFDITAFKELFTLIKNQKIDILCAHGYKSVVMGNLLAKICKIPVIAFSRGYTTENKKVAFYEWLEQKALQSVNGVVCVSHGQRKKLDKLKVKYKKCWTVHNSVSIDETEFDYEKNRIDVCNEFNIPKEKVILATAGRLSPEKGHKYLLDSINLLGNEADNCVFIICGEGMCMDQLKEQANTLNIMDKCIFAGFRRDIPRIFKAMDIMILPSLTEGLPNVILEAFAYGKPVISTNVGGVPEILEDGKSGYLTESESGNALADAIIKLINAPEKRVQMGKAGTQQVRSNFTFDEQNINLQKIYDEFYP